MPRYWFNSASLFCQVLCIHPLVGEAHDCVSCCTYMRLYNPSENSTAGWTSAGLRSVCSWSINLLRSFLLYHLASMASLALPAISDDSGYTPSIDVVGLSLDKLCVNRPQVADHTERNGRPQGTDDHVCQLGPDDLASIESAVAYFRGMHCWAIMTCSLLTF